MSSHAADEDGTKCLAGGVESAKAGRPVDSPAKPGAAALAAPDFEELAENLGDGRGLRRYSAAASAGWTDANADVACLCGERRKAREPLGTHKRPQEAQESAPDERWGSPRRRSGALRSLRRLSALSAKEIGRAVPGACAVAASTVLALFWASAGGRSFPREHRQHQSAPQSFVERF